MTGNHLVGNAPLTFVGELTENNQTKERLVVKQAQLTCKPSLVLRSTMLRSTIYNKYILR